MYKCFSVYKHVSVFAYELSLGLMSFYMFLWIGRGPHTYLCVYTKIVASTCTAHAVYQAAEYFRALAQLTLSTTF